MYKKIILGACMFTQILDAQPLVYSMRIRRVFGLGTDTPLEGEGQKKGHWLASAVPVVMSRDRHIVQKNVGVDVCEHSLLGGAVLNLRCRSPKDWWWEVTTAVAKEHIFLRGTSNFDACRTGFDDFVFSGGFNVHQNDQVQCAVYGVLGVPSRRRVNAREFTTNLVGTRFQSIGGGIECSYTCVNELQRSAFVLAQVRFLHFFDRSWFPILPCDFEIHPGNTTDVLLTVQHREKRNIFEAGYNPTIFTNQGVTSPNGTFTGSCNFARHAFYVSYAHICKNECNPLEPIILGTGLSTTFADFYNTKIFTWWFNISKVF